MNAAPSPQLIITSDTSQSIDLPAQTTWSIDLSTQAVWSVGRSSTNEIVVDEGSVSRHHAKIEVFDNRHCYFVDLDSSNGSLVNQKPVTKPLLLKHGDVITIGTTNIRLNFPFVTHSSTTALARPKKVLMMHNSATQGIIWQEILCSQGFDVQWVPPATNLQKKISLDAVANRLPDLLLIDWMAYQGDVLAFWAWCNQTYPLLPSYLILSTEASASIVEINVTLPTGKGKIIPALPSVNLPMHINRFVEQLKFVANEVSDCKFNQDDLLKTLCSLEESFNRSSIPPIITSQPNHGEELDEFTILNHSQKLVAR